MGDNSARFTIIRHWTLLSKLPISSPGVTTSALTEKLSAAGFYVSKRQVERDLKDLEQFFALGCNDKGKPYGWYWPLENRKRFFLVSLPVREHQQLIHQLDPLYQKLYPHDFSSQISHLKKGFVGRLWLFKSIEQWHDKSRSPILWIKGIAGTGKSAIAACLVKRDGLNVVGHFFCRYQRSQEPEAQARDFAQTLASQLAEKYPIFRSNLLGRLASNPNLLCPDATSRELFERLVVEPLEQIALVTESAIVVIDGLDEASGTDGLHPLADLLMFAAERFPPWLRFVATSRPATSIQQRLGRFETLTIEPDNENHLSDIFAYVESQIPPLVAESKREVLINEVVEKSEGSFLYAAAIARANDLEILVCKTLPASIDDFLRTNFERFFPDTEKYTTLQAPLLSIVAAFSRPLPEDLACQLLTLTQREWMTRLQPILGSLLIKRDHGYEPFHRCLIDWLVDPSRSGPYTVPLDGEQKIGTFLFNQMNSSQWLDLSPIQRHLVLSCLPEFIKATAQWQNAEMLLTLATGLHKAYQYHDEASIVRRILELVERQPSKHTLMVHALCQSAANHRCLGNLDDAYVELQRAQRIAEQELSKLDALCIEIYCQFGLTACRAGDFGSAGEWFKKSLGLCRDEAERAKLLNNAGRMLMHLPHRREEAEVFLHQSLQIRSRVYGDKHPQYGATLNNLAYLCMLDDRLEEAEKLFRQSLAVKQTRDTGYDESIALTEANLGSVYLRQGKTMQAETHLLSALAKREALYGENSIPVAKTLKNLCQVRLAQQRYEEALNDSKRAVECYEMNLGQSHLSTVKAMKSLAETQLKMGQRLLAHETAQSALTAAGALCGNTKTLLSEIEEIQRLSSD